MRSLLLTLLLVVFSFGGAHVGAKPLGLARIKGKVISYNKSWIHAKVAGKKVKLPRSVVSDKKLSIGVERDFYLSQNQLTFVKMQYFRKPATKK